MNRLERIQAALAQAFSGAEITVTDDSHLHAGHAGAATGRGHFSVRVVWSGFAGQPLLSRHRAIYAALDELMQTDIHALAIDARAH
jgi:BolA family transcriptional regulator, general stress-responsive regulator